MRTVNKIAWVFCALLIGGIAATAQTTTTVNVNARPNTRYNLVTNGHFENRTLGWSNRSNATAPLTDIIQLGVGRTNTLLLGDAGHGARLSFLNNTTNNMLYQDINHPVRRGDTLNLSYWARNLALGGANVTLNAVIVFYESDPNGIASPTFMPTSSTTAAMSNPFVRNQFQVIAPMDAQFVRVEFTYWGTHPNFAVIDDVILTHRPVPMTVSVPTGGTGGGTSQWANNSTTRISYPNQVAIGGSRFYNDTAFKLSVNGKMVTDEVLVQLRNTWPDYVFDSSYQLKPLAEVEQFIRQNKHLPGMPSQKAMEQAGLVQLGEMNRKLLEKVEELTLYIIGLEKKIQRFDAKQVSNNTAVSN